MPTMPNVTGLEYPDALKALVSAGVRVLPLGIFQVDPVAFTYAHGAAAPGVVLSQFPAQGTQIAANAAVALTVQNYPMSVATSGTMV